MLYERIWSFSRQSNRTKNDFGSVNFLPISYDDRAIIDKLKKEGLIDNVRYIGMQAVGFDLTYDGLHYFDEWGDSMKYTKDKKVDVYFRVSDQEKMRL